MGVAGISVPVIIHILNRRRFRILDFAAMQFLLAAMRKNRRRLQLEKLLLLAIRCLVVLLAGAALARFTGCGVIDRLGAGARARTVVFVLDDSCSMGQKRGGRTAMAAALADLKSRIRELAPDDRVAILLCGRSEEESPFLPLGRIADRAVLLGRIDGIEPGDRRGWVGGALTAAVEILLDESEKDYERHLYLMGDFRRVDVVSSDDLQKARDYLQRLGNAGVNMAVMDYGGNSRGNLTVEEVAMDTPFSAVDRRTDVAFSIRNNGPRTVDGARVHVAVRSRDREERAPVKLPVITVDSMAAGEIVRKQVSFYPKSPGYKTLSIRLAEDELPADNAAAFAFKTRESTRVLIVDGEPDSLRPENSASFLLRTALDPRDTGGWGFNVDVVTREGLSGVVCAEYDVVCLVNVPDVPAGDGERPPFLAALEKYVAGGGGLLIFMGDRVDTAFYNGPLYRRGEGLNPFPIRTMKGNPRRLGEAFRIDPGSIRDTGPVSFFGGEKGSAGAGMVRLIRFFAFTPAEENVVAGTGAAETPVVEARFDDRNASPAIVSRQYGTGRQMVVYSSASTEWNDWGDDEPQGIFVMPMASIVEWLSRSRNEVFAGPVGRAISATPGDRGDLAGGVLMPPGSAAPPVALSPARSADGTVGLFYENPRRAGVYRLSMKYHGGGAEDRFFARNIDPLEGRLAPAGRDEIASIFGGVEFSYMKRGTGKGRIEDMRPARSFWIWMIAGLLALLALETFLAWKFGHWSRTEA